MKKVLMIAIICLMTGLSSLAFALNGGTAAIAVTGTAVQLSAVSKIQYDIIVRAHPDNSAVIYLGGSDVSSDTKNGVALSAGDVHVIDYDSLTYVYIVGTAGDSVGFTYR